MIDGTPCAVKAARTVWTGGKAGDGFKGLPIGIVYGIAITAMSFFTDPTISTLTSGTPSQNADLSALSFPRRVAVRFHADFIKRYHLVGLQARWMSYEDPDFQNAMGEDFYHEDLITREGWANYYFKGKYPSDIAYIKLELVNPQTKMLVREFYFKFTKLYQTTLDARSYVKDPVLDEKIVKDGIIQELRQAKTKSGKIKYVSGHVTFKQEKIARPEESAEKEMVKTRAIISTSIRYADKCKIIFLVTPPHLMKYAKLILILVKQLVDLNFDKAYMTKSRLRDKCIAICNVVRSEIAMYTAEYEGRNKLGCRLQRLPECEGSV